jgi:cytoplasmic iron level regulating protein YaaA (DUF328/UPF0246 family)
MTVEQIEEYYKIGKEIQELKLQRIQEMQEEFKKEKCTC